MSDNQKKLSLRQNPLADYFHQRQDSPITRAYGTLLRTWRCFNTRPVKKVVPFDRLLRGGEHGLSSAAYARHTGDFLRPSTPISQSPQVRFLEEYKRIGEEIFRPEVFRQTAYFANAVQCMNVVGQYFYCTREEEVEQIARGLVNRFNGKEQNVAFARSAPEFSSPDSMVRVCPIEFSDCYEVLDGNHRLAIAYVRGEKSYGVLVTPPSVRTPLQQLIRDYAWCAIRGEMELYQPVESPELGRHWILIRRCVDRFEMMKKFLEEHSELLPERPTYLDIACSYGWFVRAFGELGFDAYGVEIDWAAIEIGRRVYGLKPEQVTRSEAVRFLQKNPGSHDVVSCFSLMHHFILNQMSISAIEMLKLIDRATKTILFFDMGQEHEEWFRESLAGWNADRIEQWLRENTTFTKIHRLGTDQDNVQPFANNYGRTLFACMR
ncbi:MAG: hypothetical protein AUG51_12445 [Acidobacteria bacterium 13_1_20CM_3_53_8]|nr:MAG: hypothetical protein AUG51_12445 [Acidobacteria bacterium 13_1_20CM_3_53_8]